MENRRPLLIELLGGALALGASTLGTARTGFRFDALLVAAGVLLLVIGWVDGAGRRVAERLTRLRLTEILPEEHTNLLAPAVVVAALAGFLSLLISARSPGTGLTTALVAGTWVMVRGYGLLLTRDATLRWVAVRRLRTRARDWEDGVLVRGTVRGGVLAGEDGAIYRVSWDQVRWLDGRPESREGMCLEIIGRRVAAAADAGGGMVPWYGIEPHGGMLFVLPRSRLHARLGPALFLGLAAAACWASAVRELLPDLLESFPGATIEECTFELWGRRAYEKRVRARAPSSRSRQASAACNDELILSSGRRLDMVPFILSEGARSEAGVPGVGDWVEKRRFEVALRTSNGTLPYKGQRSGRWAIFALFLSMAAWSLRRRTLVRTPILIDPGALWLTQRQRRCLEAVPFAAMWGAATFVYAFAPHLYGFVVMVAGWWAFVAAYALMVLRGPRLRRRVLRCARRTVAARAGGIDVAGELCGGVLHDASGRRFTAAWQDACWPDGVVRLEDGTRIAVVGSSRGEEVDATSPKLERQPAPRVTHVEPCDGNPVLVELA